MAAMPAHVSSDRPARNWFHLAKGWKRHPRWKAITPAHRIVFYTLLDIANELWFPDSVQLYEAELADESGISTRTVKRALAELSDVGVLHIGVVEEDADRRIAVRIRIDYNALTRLGSRQNADSIPKNLSQSAGLRRPQYNSRTNSRIVLADNFVFQRWEGSFARATNVPSARRTPFTFGSRPTLSHEASSAFSLAAGSSRVDAAASRGISARPPTNPPNACCHGL